MKEKIFSVLQRVGRAFMLPIAILPVAGLLLGIGSSFTNVTTLETYHLINVMGPGTFMYNILTVMNKCGSIIFDNLPLIFAIGVAIGMAKKEKEVAALAAAIAFLVMHSAIGAMIDINGGVDALMDGAATSVLGITSLQMGAFGGIIVGLGVAALHNRFYNIKLPQALSFFGGTRFVPHICARKFCHDIRIYRNICIWSYQEAAYSFWTSSCILSSILADSSWWNNDGGRSCG